MSLNTQQKSNRNIIKTVKQILDNFQVKPVENKIYDYFKNTQNSNLNNTKYDQYANNLYQNYFGYDKEKLRKNSDFSSSDRSNLNPRLVPSYIKLPALYYPVNDMINNSKKNASFIDNTDNISLKSNTPDLKPTPGIILRNMRERMVKDYAFGSKSGQISSVKDKDNQDSAIVEANFGKGGNSHFFGVADGHGTFGEKVSFFVKLTLPSILHIARSIIFRTFGKIINMF